MATPNARLVRSMLDPALWSIYRSGEKYYLERTHEKHSLRYDLNWPGWRSVSAIHDGIRIKLGLWDSLMAYRNYCTRVRAAKRTAQQEDLRKTSALLEHMGI